MNWDKSEELFQKSKNIIPGGVNSPVRAFQAVGRSPIFIEKAFGSKLYDVNGNEYIDYVCSWGPSILGHSPKVVVEAVKRACENGLSFGAPTEKEYILASLIKECMPSMEMTRLVSSGTEAVMSAIRVARGYTKRDFIVKFRGCYHGHSDGLLVKAGSGALTQSLPDSEGVPFDYTKNTLIADYNDVESVDNLFRTYGDNIAAIIVEPVAANMGVVLPDKGFLEFLRKITDQYGALLIFDEVITGFRLGLSGAQGYFGITPDLTTLGKIIGGGMPLGAYGGKRVIMEMVAPIGPVYQAGTLSGNPIATTAGIETLSYLKINPEIYIKLEKQINKIVESIRTRFENQVCINQVGSLVSTFFTAKKVTDYNSALTSDTKNYAKYFQYLLTNGIYIAPSQYEAMFISNAHSDEDIEKTCKIINKF
jgi:glutamate-1-semialdehyde 2,1-aminomutase